VTLLPPLHALLHTLDLYEVEFREA
jgi:hypothetical protein